MINVVGAGEDPENLTPATFYNFTPKQKSAPEPVKPVAQSPESPLQGTPVVITTIEPLPSPEPIPTIAPETILEPALSAPPLKPLQKPKHFLVAGIVGFLVLGIGISVAVYLGQSNQDVRQQASTAQEEVAVIPTARPTIKAKPTAQPTQVVLNDGEQLALATVPTATPTPELVTTTEFCGQSCNVDENCQNPTHSCEQGHCKLSSNPSSLSCKTPSGGSEVQLDAAQLNREYRAYATLTGETPQSGPANWLSYGLLGIGALGIGATLLLFL